MRSEPTAFAALFGAAPTVVASAPGRVNLLGEHTDYNLGFVLPTAIPQQTTVELRAHTESTATATGNRRIRVASQAIAGEAVHSYTLGGEAPRHDWLDYVQGVTQILAAAGHALPGCDLRITSAVPLGSGLSSSAALLVALFRAFRQLLSLSLSDLDIARLGQRVENEFVGAPVGILDPMACGLCQPGTALFLDTRDLRYERLPLPDAIEPLVIHSGITHSHGRSDGATAAPVADYRVRRAECEAAAQQLGVSSLRELSNTPETQARWQSLAAPLPSRVRHVLSENARVLRAVELLRKPTPSETDLQELGALFAASHRSQRIDYEVSLPAIDTLVELAANDPGVIPGGARLTGGGFGGSIVALARRGQGRAAGARILAAYGRATGERAMLLVPEASPVYSGESP